MSNYNNLKTAIQQVIKQNGKQEITGDILHKIHEVYSLDDENAIIRKEIARLGNTSEEFNAYNAYAEQCKADVKKGH